MDEPEIFAAALERSPEAREAWLERACAGDAALRARVARLLAAHALADGFLQQPAPVAPPASPVASGDRIGPYRLEEEIGSGGFGVVYAAEQTTPVRRRVALKVIKAGMDTREVVTRFEAERQALALMDHPHIARVFDGGSTPGGRPFFVMELVLGVPIHEYCDQSRLTLRERLRLFVQVCRAVQHAHQKGIIHRDLKPSNVMVAIQDGDAVPKVIDFGVAKATGQSLNEETFHTRFAQMIGTPQYMSPEQAEMSALDVDTRSDVYSLGVLLYELLVGSTPLERERVRTATFDELRWMIRHEDPPTPSARMSALNGDGARIAAARRVPLRRLVRQVHGDLDWIVMRAIEKDRARRYDSAAALADDVERHLTDEPLEAGPPSVLYRLRKFGRRHRTALAIAALLLAVLGGLGWNLQEGARRKARLARDVESALDEAARIRERAWSVTDDFAAWEAQHVAARSALERAEALLGAAPGGGRADLGVLVDAAGDALATDERDRRMVATLDRLATERTFGYEREWDEDERHRSSIYREAFRDYGVVPGSQPPEDCGAWIAGKRTPVRDALIRGLDVWMVAALNQRQGEELWIAWTLARADPDPWRCKVRAAQRALDIGRLETLALDPGRHDPADLHGLALHLYNVGKKDLAIDLMMAGQERHPERFLLNLGLACSLFHAGRIAEAATYMRIAVALRPESRFGYAGLCAAQMGLEDWEGARRSALRSLELDPDSAEDHDNLGGILYRLGRYAEAVAEHQKAIDLAPDLDEAHFGLGRARWQLGDRRGALDALKEAVRLAPEKVHNHTELYHAHRENGDLDAAVQGVRAALAHHGQNADIHCDLAALLLQQDKAGEAEAACRRALDLDPEMPQPHGTLAQILVLREDLDGALREALLAVELGQDSMSSWTVLGETRQHRGELREAVKAYRKAIELEPEPGTYANLCGALFLLEDLDGAVEAGRNAVGLAPNNALWLFNLGLALAAKKQWDDAIEIYQRAVDNAPGYFDARGNLAGALFEAGRVREAFDQWEEALKLAPDDARMHNMLAWFLVTQEGLRPGDAERAVRHGLAAVRLAGEQGGYWNTLGVAQYRAGNFASAVEALEKSMALQDGGTPHDWLFLAMAHHALGEPDEARRWYEQATAAMAMQPEQDAELLRFRAEAETRLGLARDRDK